MEANLRGSGSDHSLISASISWSRERGLTRDRSPRTHLLAPRFARRPAARQRLVKVDERRRAARARIGKGVLRLQSRAFGVEHVEQVGRTGVERTRASCAARALSSAARSRCASSMRACPAARARSRFPRARAARCARTGQRAGRGGIGRGDARTHAADVEERPVDAERDEPRFAVALEQRAAVERLACRSVRRA